MLMKCVPSVLLFQTFLRCNLFLLPWVYDGTSDNVFFSTFFLHALPNFTESDIYFLLCT
jgi:hypothetical protein